MVNTNEDEGGAERKALRDLQNAQADLKHAEGDVKDAEEELEEALKHEIPIIVDGTEYRVPGREWVVSNLKIQLGIDQAKVLAEITPQGLKDLDDNETIKLHRKEQFMTHARSGGSS